MTARQFTNCPPKANTVVRSEVRFFFIIITHNHCAVGTLMFLEGSSEVPQELYNFIHLVWIVFTKNNKIFVRFSTQASTRWLKVEPVADALRFVNCIRWEIPFVKYTFWPYVVVLMHGCNIKYRMQCKFVTYIFKQVNDIQIWWECSSMAVTSQGGAMNNFAETESRDDATDMNVSVG